jgi:hypothetical protein
MHHIVTGNTSRYHQPPTLCRCSSQCCTKSTPTVKTAVCFAAYHALSHLNLCVPIKTCQVHFKSNTNTAVSLTDLQWTTAASPNPHDSQTFLYFETFVRALGPIVRALGPIVRALGPIVRALGPIVRALGPIVRAQGPIVRALEPNHLPTQRELWLIFRLSRSRGVESTTNLPLKLRLRISGAIPLLLVYALMAWVLTTLHLRFLRCLCPAKTECHIQMIACKEETT